MGSACGVQLDTSNCLEVFGISNFIVGPLGPIPEPFQGNQTSAGVDQWTFNWMGNPETAPSPSDDPVGFARNADGRLEAFVRSSNGGAVWHIWQQADSSWSGWNSMGGSIDGGPVAAVNQDGRIEVFARKGGTLFHNWQLQPNGGTGWSGWQSLGGAIDGQVSVGMNPDGRLEAFARGGGKLQHIWQTVANGGWSGWGSLGGALDGDPVVALNPGNAQRPGWLEVFARSGGALAHIWQGAGGWSSWGSLGGGLSGDPAVGVNPVATGGGRVEVFARGSDGALWHIWQQVAGGDWSGWNSLGGSLDGNYTPAVASNADGRLEVFAWLIGDDFESLQCIAQQPGGWSAWVQMNVSADAKRVAHRRHRARTR